MGKRKITRKPQPEALTIKHGVLYKADGRVVQCRSASASDERYRQAYRKMGNRMFNTDGVWPPPDGVYILSGKKMTAVARG